ncbi:hypothetical protein KCP69_18905 [Salmonella enterica subsp. enterica]|nr:hypothetical protein KCP69_18905 [Salmonella enterica subsp. enterica]
MQIVLRHFLPLPTTRAPLRKNAAAGLVSEVVYHEDQPAYWRNSCFCLYTSVGPITRGSSGSRAAKARREWVRSSGLPLTRSDAKLASLRLVIRWSR